MSDKKDRQEAIGIAVPLLIAILLVGVSMWLATPIIDEFINNNLAAGVGVKDAAVIAFFISIFVIIVLALFAGDGLIGEFQFMIPAFIGFYILIWFQIAWIF